MGKRRKNKSDNNESRGMLSTDGTAYNWTNFGRTTLAGTVVDHHNADTLSGVRKALSLYSNAVACIAFGVYRKLPKGGRLRATENPVDYLIADEPNDEYSAHKFWQCFGHDLASRGNAYAEVIRGSDGTPTALYVLHGHNVQVFRDERERIFYKLLFEGRVLPAEDVIHVSLMGGSDGIIGYSPIAKGADALGYAKGLYDQAAANIGNGNAVGGVIEFATPQSQVAQAKFREELGAVHQGPDKSGKPMLLPFGAKWVQSAFSPADQETLASRVFTLGDIARIWNLPEWTINGAVPTPPNEEASTQLYESSYLPVFKNIEAEFTRKLFSRDERKVYRISHDFRSYLEGNAAARGTWYQTLKNIGVFHTNDVLISEGMNPISEEEGGFIRYVQGANIPLQYVGQAYESIANPVAQPEVEEIDPAKLLAITSQVSAGTLPLESAKGVLATCFPTLSPAQIDAIIDPIEPVEENQGDEQQPDDEPQDQTDDSEAVAALRDVLSEGVRRMVVREVGAVRKAAKRPLEFRDWLGKHETDHSDALTQALGSTLRAIGAVTGEPLDVGTLVGKVIEESRDRLHGLVVTCPPDELPGAIERLVGEWGDARVDAIVETLMGGSK